MINCPYCGKLTDPKLDSCPHCGGYVQKKGTGRAPDAKRSAGQTCPNCQALVHDGDIICVGCGTNLLTGQKIAEEQKTRVAREPRNWLPWAALGGVALVVAVVAGVFAFYAFTRDPVKRAVQLAYAGNLLEAGNTLSHYLESHDDDSRAHFELGRIQWKMGRMAEAAGAFEKAYANDPANTDAAMLAVVAYGNSGEPATRQQQVAILMDLTERFPDNGDAWYLLALVLGAQNDVDGQLNALEKAAAAGVDANGIRRSLAVAMGMKGEVEKAQRELLGLYDAAADADTHAAAGFIYSLAGEYDAAQEFLEQAIASGTSVQAHAQTRLGLLLLSQGRSSEAIPHLAAAVENDKRNAQAQFFHALALEAEGQDFEALTALEAVAATKDPLAGEAALRASGLYLAQGNVDKAREAIGKAETAGIKTAACHTMRGRVYMAAGEPLQAAEAFARARQADPQYPGVYLEAGLMHIQQQDFHQAMEQLDKYLALAESAATAGGADAGSADEVRALVEQLRQAGAAPAQPAYGAADAGDERSL